MGITEGNAQGETRTRTTLRPTDFKPCTSYQLTNTATTAIKPTAINLTQPAPLTPAVILNL